MHDYRAKLSKDGRFAIPGALKKAQSAVRRYAKKQSLVEKLKKMRQENDSR